MLKALLSLFHAFGDSSDGSIGEQTVDPTSLRIALATLDPKRFAAGIVCHDWKHPCVQRRSHFYVVNKLDCLPVAVAGSTQSRQDQRRNAWLSS